MEENKEKFRNLRRNSALDSRSNGPGSRPGPGHYVVFMGKTLDSHSASLHTGV